MLVLLDSKPLGMVTNPKASPATKECNEWLERLLAKGVEVFVPEIIDYELRRELTRINALNSIRKLDSLGTGRYLPLNTEIMKMAAKEWARLRNIGQGTASELALDIDCILASQAITISTNRDGEETIIATIDVNDLSRYNTSTVTAKLWKDVT